MAKYDTSEFSQYPDPGMAHFLITEIEAVPSEKFDGDDYKVSCQVLAHELPGQEGKTYLDYFGMSGKGKNRFFSLALACGLVTREELLSGEVDFDYEDLYSKTFCGLLEEQTYNGTKRNKIGFKFVDPNSPEADGWPKSEEFTEKKATPSGGQKKTAKKAVKKPVTVPDSDDSDFDIDEDEEY